jgi:alpha-beta hydrolase superfamily lysophospholipase
LGCLAGLLVLYLLLVGAAFALQDRMLYYPEIRLRSEMADLASQLEFRLWPEGADDYYGLVSAAPLPASRGTVLVWHGNAGSALHRGYYVPALQRLGFRVVLLEYPGYGARVGKLGEKPFVDDALRATRLAASDFGDPLYVWGESLGCGVASAVAADPEAGVQGAVMLTPWDTLPALAQSIYWYLPARWLVRDRYDNVRNLREFDGPVAVVMAAQDEIVPNRHTIGLYESLPGRKKLWVFEGAGHNTWPTAADARWWAEVAAFLSDTP